MSAWYVYILQCHDGTFYTGITTDVERRLHEHNHSKRAAKYTRVRRPVRLVYHCTCETRSAAASEEYRVRHLPRDKKQALIRQFLGDAQA